MMMNRSIAQRHDHFGFVENGVASNLLERWFMD